MENNILNADTVESILRYCLFGEGESVDSAIKVDGVVYRYDFHPERIKEKAAEIKSQIMELPDDFMLSKGGGMSFLSACMDKHGNHWGEHRNIEQLLVLAIAAGFAKWLLPREAWSICPGGMPYVQVIDKVKEAA